jgi:hypothetical protein
LFFSDPNSVEDGMRDAAKGLEVSLGRFLQDDRPERRLLIWKR